VLSICLFVVIVREFIEKKLDLFLFVSLKEFSCIKKVVPMPIMNSFSTMRLVSVESNYLKSL
jgi:hypothetical protein